MFPSHDLIGSGVVVSGQLGDNTVSSGNISSGSISAFHIASGGAFSSGLIGSYSIASGTIITRAGYVTPYNSGLLSTIITEEPISGVRAVTISQSGVLRIAMASVSGRMPAIGIVVDNVASGIQANVYAIGAFQLSSGMNDFSGYLGQPLVVGRSGQIVTYSGSWNSGGLMSGDILQLMGSVGGNSGF